jgi:hypothetical protein
MFAVEVNSGTQIASGAKLGAALRDERAALVQFEPATRDRQLCPTLYSAGVPLSPNRNGPLIFSI